MKRNVKSLIVLLAALTLLTALLPIMSLANQNSQYLKSGKEISFRAGDSVSQKAQELIQGKRTTEEQAMAIYSYIVTNFSYDYSFADAVRAGKITRYTPDPNSILTSRKGVCYDFSSLFAAMCRSVGIPAIMYKGYTSTVNGYHAWNGIYDDATGKWVVIDLTVDIYRNKGATSSWRKVSGTYNAKSKV